MEVMTYIKHIRLLMAVAGVSFTVVSLGRAAPIAGLPPDSHVAVAQARISPAGMNSGHPQLAQQPALFSVAT